MYGSLCAGRAREGRGEHPRVQDSEDGVQWDKPPETKPERVQSLRVRSLRTQQRAESQCHMLNPFVGFFGLMDIESVQFSVLGLVSNSSTESLILAQDERWRRA